MSFLAVYVNGDVEEIEEGYESIKSVIHNIIDFVFLHDDLGFFIDDEGMLNYSRLNVVASIVAGRALYGNVVATRGHPDDEGNSMPVESKAAIETIRYIAHRWKHVTDDAQRLGQDPYAISNPDDIPPPTITELPKDFFFGVDDP